MCGIFAYVGNETNGPQIVFEGIKELEYRGYDSWGIAVQEAGAWWLKKQVGKIGSSTGDDLPEGVVAFGHTRWATHGGITVENAHPHVDCAKKIALIHNGIVENYEELKKELEQKGHVFSSETDSEVVVHLIEENHKKYPFEQAVVNTYKRLRGQSAIIVSLLGQSLFVAIKNGSPLVVGYGDNANYIASDSSALISYTKKVYFLEDNQVAIVDKEKIVISNLEGKRVDAPNTVLLSGERAVASKGEYDHYMQKEIHEQASVIEAIASQADAIDQVVSDIQTHDATIFSGCGSAFHASLAARELVGAIANRQVFAEVASDITSKISLWSQRDVVIALSQSGETMDVLESVKALRQRGIAVDALVNVYGSTLYRMANSAVLLQAGTERAVASTKAFIAKLATITLIAYALANKKIEGIKRLKIIATAIKRQLFSENIAPIQKLANSLKEEQHLYVVGRGVSYVGALETALKIKEISYIHAEGLRCSEFKHGPIALITKGSKCVLFLPNDGYYEETISIAQELKARGGYIIGVSPKANGVFDQHIHIEDLENEAVFAEIIFGQLLSYYLAVAKSLDPDMPRNLAKSVTVK